MWSPTCELGKTLDLMSSPSSPKKSRLLLAHGRLKSGWAERSRSFLARDVMILGKSYVLYTLTGFYDCAFNAIWTPEAAPPAMTLVSPHSEDADPEGRSHLLD